MRHNSAVMNNSEISAMMKETRDGELPLPKAGIPVLAVLLGLVSAALVSGAAAAFCWANRLFKGVPIRLLGSLASVVGGVGCT